MGATISSRNSLPLLENVFRLLWPVGLVIAARWASPAGRTGLVVVLAIVFVVGYGAYNAWVIARRLVETRVRVSGAEALPLGERGLVLAIGAGLYVCQLLLLIPGCCFLPPQPPFEP